MAFKTMSRNCQRWKENPLKLGKGRKNSVNLPPVKVDFGKPLGIAIAIIHHVLVSCEKCAKTELIKKYELKERFSLDTKFHIIWSTLSKKTKCCRCNGMKHKVKIEYSGDNREDLKIKLGRAEDIYYRKSIATEKQLVLDKPLKVILRVKK